MTTPADRIEAAAQLLHERRHRAGTAQVCGVCRDDAAAVARVIVLEPRQGMCGDMLPPLMQGQTPEHCELPYGHGGWHERQGGARWSGPPT